MIAFLWVVLSISVAVLVRWQWQKRVKFAGALPRAKPYYPVVGNLPLAIGKNPNELFDSLYECFRQHDRMFTLQFSTIVAVCPSHPELIQRVLNHPDCQEKPDVYKVVRLPKGLLAARYETWKVHRKTLNSTFNTKILHSFLSIFNNSSRRLIDRLGQCADGGESCNILKYISECTLEMICRTSLGGKALEREGRQDFIENLEVALTTLGKRIFSISLHNDFIYQFTTLYREEMKATNTCHQFTDKIIAEKHIEFKSLYDGTGNPAGEALPDEDDEENYKRPQIFIDQLMKMPLLMKDAYSFSDQEISDHVYTMIVAGNETSATQLAHTCLLLAMNPDVQEKAYQEVQQVITSSDMFVDTDTLKQLVYVEAVLKEAMRLIPVAPLIARENIRDIELDGHRIPKGTVFLMNIYALHRRSDIWGLDSERFNPDRFLGDEARRRHPFAHLPFSGGPRGCIGYRYAMMSLKILLALILKNFEITTDIKYSDIKYHYQISLNLAIPHAVSLRRRE
ncbi:cytochrome P450 4C1-like [Ochlerotatus camptorhynchus]|uniref:cytochrome P450 4C1-like n=1 Tax=Ochlerotatus camptorhynchus TaxID=644619 RepID=UPI0031D2A3C3